MHIAVPQRPFGAIQQALRIVAYPSLNCSMSTRLPRPRFSRYSSAAHQILALGGEIQALRLDQAHETHLAFQPNSSASSAET
jgi:hypothetical protein